MLKIFEKIFGSKHDKDIKKLQPVVQSINELQRSFETLSNEQLKAKGVEIRNKVRGIAHESDVAKVTVVGVADRPGIAAALFEPLAEAGVSVDVIVQNASSHGVTDLSFTVKGADLPRTVAIAELAAREAGAKEVEASPGWAKVSIVGSGMQHSPGYASRMFRTLADRKINIEMITTSEIRITCIVRAEQVGPAVRALHESFELETP